MFNRVAEILIEAPARPRLLPKAANSEGSKSEGLIWV